ncbi:LysR family transcriptional regulator [Aestuariirhabdus litorea]|uniref:LysR family transcriptional regulator n=1 Tax=Aestuariirhabdus litorea TaxID=2528527 RepID=A0A3P3VQ67_9GAMM|nr:LysR family transcriptional regulator [Aestuariirhabdus litorea]RRJ84931.1 LysR family transcriptional regulator [Aestuariirhabdus litorea]RWW98156.1 LysR family transcriptional regulator [Endozoicomonadaceae bacterium GTF-13]
METSALHAFVAVAECGSFSLAGERLHLTQPAISKRIASLESQLNTRLFDRIGRQVGLTESGSTLLPKAYAILAELADAKRQINNLKGDVSGSLSISTSHHIGLHRLPPVLRQFSRQHPQVALDIHFVDSEVAYDEVIHGQIELGIITLAPEQRQREFIHSARVWRDPLCFVVSREHPLAQASPLSLAELSRYSAIFPGPNTFTHHIVKGLFTAHKLELRVSMATNYLETIKMMVSIGLAWSVLPRSMLDHELAELEVRGAALERDLGYIHHTGRTLSNAAQAFIDTLHAHQENG